MDDFDSETNSTCQPFIPSVRVGIQNGYTSILRADLYTINDSRCVTCQGRGPTHRVDEWTLSLLLMNLVCKKAYQSRGVYKQEHRECVHLNLVIVPP